MDIGYVSNLTSAVASTDKSRTDNKLAEEKDKDAARTGFDDEAAVYEKSKENSVVNHKKLTREERAQLVEKLQADAAANKAQFIKIVRHEIVRQGHVIGTSDDIWKILANGDFKASPETIEQARKDISEDGYWGVEKTSDRILEFARALSGDNTAKADELLNAFKKGFKEATRAWGKELPEISQKTYETVESKFNNWKNNKEK